MSESEPEQDPHARSVFLEFGDTSYELTPETTCIYLHEGDDIGYDHIFMEVETDPEQEAAGVAFFRECIGNFDEVVGFLRDRDYAFVEKQTVSNFDKEMYHNYFGQDHYPPNIYRVPTYELTDRHERLIRAFGEALLNIPEDLFWDGIENDTERPYPEKWV